MNKKNKQLVNKLTRKAMRVAAAVKFQQTGIVESVQVVKQVSKSFLRSEAWKILRLQAIKKYGDRCCKCGKPHSKKHPINIDHIKPRKYYPELSLDINNLQPLCGRCNKLKGNGEPVDYRPLVCP